MNRPLKIAGIIIGVIVAILLILPFFINVDKFRPQIESKIGVALNSKVVLGKLTLGLIPTLSINTDKLVITPNNPLFPEPVIKSDQFKLSIPLYSLLGSPTVTVKLDKPEIFVVERNDKLNVQTMTSGEKSAAASAKTETAPEESTYLSRKIENAQLTLLIRQAKIRYKTQSDEIALVVDEMLLRNLGYNSSIDVKIVSQVDYKGDSGMAKGPFEFSGDIQTNKSGNDLGATFALVGDFSKMLIKAGATFHKPEKTALKFDMKGTFKKATNIDINISKLNFELASFKLAGKLNANGIGSTDASTVDIDIKNESSRLEDLSDLSPLLADYKLKGALVFSAKIEGPTKNPKLDIDVRGDDLKGQTPKLNLPIEHLKVHLKVGGTLEDPTVELDPANILIGKSDVQLKLKARGLKAPDAKVEIRSKSLDLAFLSTGKESKAEKVSTKEAAGKSLDASLDEMADSLETSLKNKMLDRAKVEFIMSLGELKLEGAKLVNVQVNSTLAARQLTIKQASFSGYGGNIALTGSSHLIPAAPTYNYTLKLQTLDVAQLIAAHAPAWKGQLSGTLNGVASVGGEGLKKAQVASNLRGGIKGAIVKGNTSLQLSKIVSTVMKQLPQKPDLKSQASEDRLKGKFKTLTLDSKIVGRKINFTNLDIIFEPDEYNLGEMQFKAAGSLTFDRQLDLSGNVFLSPQVVKWPEAVGSSGKIEIPVKISGAMDSASPDVGYTISKMGGRVLKKTLQKEAKKGVENILKSKGAQDLLKGIFK